MSFTNIVQTAGNVQGVIGTVKNFTQSVLSFFGSDITGIFDSTTYEQLFTDARPIKAVFTRTVKIMDHPIESGAIISDFAINLPVEIDFTMIVTGDNYDQTLQKILQYEKSHTTLIVQLKVGTLTNVIIDSVAYDESPDVFDAAPITMRLRQVQVIKVQYQALTQQQVAQPKDQSTVNRGAQQPKESALYQISKFVGGIFK